MGIFQSKKYQFICIKINNLTTLPLDDETKRKLDDDAMRMVIRNPPVDPMVEKLVSTLFNTDININVFDGIAQFMKYYLYGFDNFDDADIYKAIISEDSNNLMLNSLEVCQNKIILFYDAYKHSQYNYDSIKIRNSVIDIIYSDDMLSIIKKSLKILNSRM